MLSILRKVITSGKTGLFFSVGLAATGIWNKNLNESFIYIFVGLCIIYVFAYIIFSIIDWVRMKRWITMNRQVVVNKFVEHDWRINTSGDFHGNYSYEVENFGKNDISILPFDDVLWFEDPTGLKFECSLLDNPSQHKIVSYRNTIVKYIFDFLNRNTNVHSISWSNVIDPPISSGETFKYKLTIDTPRTELAAFTKKGTYAGIPATLPTKHAKLTFVSPRGYYFVLLDSPIVVDNRGKRYPDEEGEFQQPELSTTKNVLTWELEHLQVGRRYWFKYRFEKEK